MYLPTEENNSLLHLILQFSITDSEGCNLFALYTYCASLNYRITLAKAKEGLGDVMHDVHQFGKKSLSGEEAAKFLRNNYRRAVNDEWRRRRGKSKKQGGETI